LYLCGAAEYNRGEAEKRQAGRALVLGDVFGVAKPDGLVLVDAFPFAHFLFHSLSFGFLRFLVLNLFHFRLSLVVVVLLLLFSGLVLGLWLLLYSNLFVHLQIVIDSEKQKKCAYAREGCGYTPPW
jgi:hypothetical protein